MKYLAAAAFVLVAVIILLADRGTLPGFIVALYAFPNGDKVGHFLLMGGLGMLVNLALPGRPVRRHLIATLILALLVTAEEFSQNFFGTRNADWIDLLASLAGIAVLGWIGWKVKQRIERRTRSDR